MGINPERIVIYYQAVFKVVLRSTMPLREGSAVSESLPRHPWNRIMSDAALETIELETGPDYDRVVIWLHGLGADGNDFVPVVPALGLPASAKIRFVFPNAPVRPITVNGGMAMRGWYDILGTDIDRSTDAEGIRTSASQVQQLIDQYRNQGIEGRHILLAGFSQGGAIALFQGLRAKDTLAGIVALSTYLPLPDRLGDEISDAGRSVPVYMAHGIHDPVVPLALAEASHEALQAAGVEVKWSTWPIPHSVSPEEITDIGEWMSSALGL